MALLVMSVSHLSGPGGEGGCGYIIEEVGER